MNNFEKQTNCGLSQINKLTEAIKTNDIKGQDVLDFLNNEAKNISDKNVKNAIRIFTAYLGCDVFYFGKGKYAFTLSLDGENYFCYPQNQTPQRVSGILCKSKFIE